MPPAKLDLAIYRGDDFSKLLRFKDTSTDPDTYIDLTGWTGKAQLRLTEDNDTVAAEFAVTVMASQATPANTGKVTLALTSVQTAALDGGIKYKWDLQMTKTDASKETYLYGNALVSKDVTRP